MDTWKITLDYEWYSTSQISPSVYWSGMHLQNDTLVHVSTGVECIYRMILKHGSLFCTVSAWNRAARSAQPKMQTTQQPSSCCTKKDLPTVQKSWTDFPAPEKQAHMVWQAIKGMLIIVARTTLLALCIYLWRAPSHLGHVRYSFVPVGQQATNTVSLLLIRAEVLLIGSLLLNVVLNIIRYTSYKAKVKHKMKRK